MKTPPDDIFNAFSKTRHVLTQHEHTMSLCAKTLRSVPKAVSPSVAAATVVAGAVGIALGGGLSGKWLDTKLKKKAEVKKKAEAQEIRDLTEKLEAIKKTNNLLEMKLKEKEDDLNIFLRNTNEISRLHEFINKVNELRKENTDLKKANQHLYDNDL